MSTITTPTLAQKLNPRRFPGMSGKMAAIVGYILGEKFTTPSFSDMIISGGAVLAMKTGDIGYNEFIGASADLFDNLNRLMDAAGLTVGDRFELSRLVDSKVKRS